MASLPHGWHGPLPPSTVKTTMPPPPVKSASKMTVTLSQVVRDKAATSVGGGRKKWAGTNDLRRNGLRVSDRISSRGNSSKTKEDLQLEVVTLKKELSQLKEENVFLKARLRRTDEENVKKARQLEKLILSNAQNEDRNGERRKTITSESVVTLKQKIARLEQMLRDKDASLRRLQSDTRAVKVQEMKTLLEAYHHELITLKGNNHKLPNITSTAKLPSTSINQRRTKSSPSKIVHNHPVEGTSNQEVTRLRENMRKQQKQNQNLQQQLKERDQEIQDLKQKLQKQAGRTGIARHPTPHTHKSSLQHHGKNTSEFLAKTTTPKQGKTPTLRKPTGNQPLSNQAKTFMKTGVDKPENFTLKNSSNIPTHNPPPQLTNQKTVQSVQSKPSPQSSKTFVITKTHKTVSLPNSACSTNSEIKSFREKVAARKIQRSWRLYKESTLTEKKPDAINSQEEAIDLIQSVLRGHICRLEQLALIPTPEDLFPGEDEDRLDVALTAVQKAVKDVFAKKTSKAVSS
ncbi:uncharacterized protein LOC143238633 isoform X1 [Tachypleus tridentatus]|uniref:uncharacterized protein LOC143238633 isoform X1 n=2 Tax=Tachypleus tridentatus TaxID=6853 RepID=UPI003FCF7E2F